MSNIGSTERRGSWPSSALDDAEKGIYRRRQSLVAPLPFGYTTVTTKPTPFDSSLSPTSPVHEGITPCASVPELSLPFPAKSSVGHVEVAEKPAKKPTPAEPSISRWILFELWFNAYRRFFTFVVLLNLIGIILAADGTFTYAEKYLGALVLGNLMCAVLMRNEVFVRFLYLVFIYGLRSWAPLRVKLVATSVLQHLGGIHSRCALSGAAWLVYKVVDVVRHRIVLHLAIIASGVVTNILILTSVLSASPWVAEVRARPFTAVES